MSHVRRFDHVGLTVADLDVVTAFFVALGLEVEGGTFVEGEFLDTVCGIPDSRTEIVMLKPPDDGTRLELSSFVRPDSVPGSPAAMANELGLRNVAFEVTTGRRLSIGQLPRATAWSVASASTRALGGWPTSAGRKGSSSHWPSASAEPRNARIRRESSASLHGGLLPALDGVPHVGGVLRAPGAKHLEVEVLLESLEQPLPATQHQRCGGNRELVDHTRRKALADEAGTTTERDPAVACELACLQQRGVEAVDEQEART